MIAFVILHYQAMEETISCVDTIKNMVKEEKKIVIVDNASPNKTGINLREKYSQDSEVIVLLSEKKILVLPKGTTLVIRKRVNFHQSLLS